MSHPLYKTEGLILGGTNVGESSRYVRVFTPSFGLIRVFARAVREEKSKLRYALQPLSVGTITLVRGRDVWRVIGAEENRNVYESFKDEKEKLSFLSRLVFLLLRLLHGEEDSTELYRLVMYSISYLEKVGLTDEELALLECLVVLRILALLGYVRRETFAPFLDSPSHITPHLLAEFSSLRRSAVREINRALSESQL